jgi:flagellar basal body-associated protein FliL
VKRRIIIFSITIVITGIALYGYMSTTEEAKNYDDRIQSAQYDLVLAKQSLNKTRLDASQRFKSVSAEQLNANEKRIVELKIIIVKEKKADKDIYLKKLVELEQKNKDLKMKLDEYAEEGQDRWLSFNTDMDGLKKSLRDFIVNNND